MGSSARLIKWKTFILTFFAYVSLHTMRMSYSQVKPHFQESFHLSNLFLGLFDALVYLSLGMGFFFRFLLQGRRNLINSYLLFISIATAAYLVIPLTSLLLGEAVRDSFWLQEVLPGVGLLVFGFCQFPAWPTLLTLTNEHFNLEQEGAAMGIWSANGDLGNIIGFGLAGMLVDGLSCRWEVAMLVAAGFHLVMALSVKLFLTEKSQNPENSLSLLSEEGSSVGVSGKQKFKQFMAFSKETWRLTENRLYLLSMGLLKSILYGFLLWMPTYLDHNGFKKYTSSIPIVFNAGTLFGSSFLGWFYKEQAPAEGFRASICRNLKSYSLFYSSISLTVVLGAFYGIEPEVIAYFCLSAACGFFLGGCFNMLASNEVIAMAEGKKEAVNMLSTLSMVCGNLMVGLVEVLIGVVLDLKHSADGEKKLFVLLLGVGAVAIAVLYWRSRIIHKKLRLQAAEYAKMHEQEPISN